MANAASSTSRPRWTLRLAGVGALTLMAAASLIVFRACSSADTGQHPPQDAKQALSPAARKVEVPTFRQPEDAERYFRAITGGDRRAILLLDQAIQKARSQDEPDPELITTLERQKAERLARLEAYEAARE